MKYLSKNRRAIISLIIIVMSVFFGINQEALNDLVAQLELDPPNIGYNRVAEVIDGDTIEVIDGDNREKVRFIGLDTPETHHPDKAVQCYGHAAKNQLERLIGSGDVRLEADPTNTNRDRYGRILRYVYTEDGALLNQEMIARGYGFAYIAFPFEKKQSFIDSQAQARSDNSGLWAECEIIIDGDYTNTAPAEGE